MVFSENVFYFFLYRLSRVITEVLLNDDAVNDVKNISCKEK